MASPLSLGSIRLVLVCPSGESQRIRKQPGPWTPTLTREVGHTLRRLFYIPGFQRDSGPGKATEHPQQRPTEVTAAAGSLGQAIGSPQMWAGVGGGGSHGCILALDGSNKTWLAEQEGQHGDCLLHFYVFQVLQTLASL